LEVMIPLQLDVSPSLLDTGKILPDSEATAGVVTEGVLPADTIDFAALMNGLSENQASDVNAEQVPLDGPQENGVNIKMLLDEPQDSGVNANQVLLDEPLDVSAEEPVIVTGTGANHQSPLSQVHETLVSPDSFSENTGIGPDDVVPPSEAISGDLPPYDITGPADSNETVTGVLLAECLPDAPRSLPTDASREVSPVSHVSEEVRTDGLYRPVQTVPAGVTDDITASNVSETPGKSVTPGSMAPPLPEGATLVPGTGESTREPGFNATAKQNVTPMMESTVLSAGKDMESSQKMALIFPLAQNGEIPQAGSGGRASLVSSQTSENISIRGPLPGGRQDVSGGSAEGRDTGHSGSSDGGKAGMPGSPFMRTAAGQDPNNISGKPETVLPGVLRKSSSENLVQIEKITWPLTGSPLTAVSEKDAIVETSRFPVEPGEIRTLTDLIEKAVWGRENGQAQARIQLKPSFMGHLHLNVIMDQLKVTVEIRAETLLARDFLETNLHVLKTDLQASGLEIDKIDVLVDPDLNNQQDQGRASAHKQTNRMNEHSKETGTLEDKEPVRSEDVILSGGEENQIDCFV